MKKLLALLLALVMVMSLVACGGTKDDTKKEDPKKGGKGKKDKKKTKFSSQTWAGTNACDEEEEKPDIYDLMQSSFDDSDDNPYLKDPFYAQ